MAKVAETATRARVNVEITQDETAGKGRNEGALLRALFQAIKLFQALTDHPDCRNISENCFLRLWTAMLVALTCNLTYRSQMSCGCTYGSPGSSKY